MSRRWIILGGLAVVVVAGWYAFRPERAFISKTVSEELPQATTLASESEPKMLLSGSFHSNAHETKGTATIYRLGDGNRVLRLTNFETSNGPDVRVYLVAAADVNENDTVKQAGFVDLGAMKGNIGDQNYDVPADVDLAKYRSVSIWCRRFSVNFGAAPLTATSM